MVLFFDDFLESQNVGYTLLKNSYFNGRLSHAYLIDANNNEKSFDFVMAFIKLILCEKKYSRYSSDLCGDCHLCERIDNGNYSEIKIISSDSTVIKKEQLLELQSDFSKSRIEGKYRIYIIKDCDKMNKQASNSLLKFLEEPNDNIIAFLITNHLSKVINTIVSRCQIIHLSRDLILSNNSSLENFAFICSDSEKSIQDFLSDSSKEDIMNTALNFIDYFEENGLDVLIFMKKLWFDVIQTKEDCLISLQILIYFYYDVLNFLLGNSNFLFCSHLNLIERVGQLNSLEKILKKIDIFQYAYSMVTCNLNINLLLDDIVIRLGDV